MPKTQKQHLGIKAESLARKILQTKSYEIITSNYYTKFGEIDIIAKHNDTLVFVEVKARSSLRKGYPEDAVNQRKILNIKKAAYMYVSKEKPKLRRFRIDVVSILNDGNQTKCKVIQGVD